MLTCFDGKHDNTAALDIFASCFNSAIAGSGPGFAARISMVFATPG